MPACCVDCYVQFLTEKGLDDKGRSDIEMPWSDAELARWPCRVSAAEWLHEPESFVSLGKRSRNRPTRVPTAVPDLIKNTQLPLPW